MISEEFSVKKPGHAVGHDLELSPEDTYLF